MRSWLALVDIAAFVARHHAAMRHSGRARLHRKRRLGVSARPACRPLGRLAALDPVDQRGQHVDVGRRAGADMVDTGRGVQAQEAVDHVLAHACRPRTSYVADAGVRTLRVVGHVLQHRPACRPRGMEGAQVRVGRVHQRRHLAHARRMVADSIVAQVGRWVACIEVLDRAGTVEPCDAVGRRCGGIAGAAAPSHQAVQPPVGPNEVRFSPLGPRPGYSRRPLASSTSSA